uniref:nucleoporin NUP188 n=1 Tax=Myxine glutinosa TaxID=7769 RepID=UPI00358E080D
MAAAGETCRSCRKLWDITLGRTAFRESAHIQHELEKRFELLCSGLGFYKSPSIAAAETLAALTGVPTPEKDFSLKISAQLHLDQVQSHELLLTYLQDAHQGARGEIETLLQDEQGASELLQKVSRFYYEERLYILRLLLYILTFFQDDRHPNQAVFASCVQRLQPERVLLKSCQDGLEAGLGAIEAGTSLPGISVVQCLRECCLQLELLFLFFTYFEMAPRHLLCLAQLFCHVRFGVAGSTASPVLAQRVGYFCVLILIGGIDLNLLFRCIRQDCVNEHQVVNDQQIFKELDSMMVRLGIVPAHGPVLLAWAVLRHAALGDVGRAQTQHLGKTAIQLQTMHFLSGLLQDPGFSGTSNCTARTARGCIYDFLSCVLNLFDENSLGDTKHLMNLACEVLVDPNLAENFWDTDRVDGLGVLLQSACTWFPLQLTPLLHLLSSLVCNRSTAKRVYSFFSQLEGFAEGVMTRPRGMDVTEDENVWRIRATRQLYPPGAGQTNLRMPAGTEGVLLGSGPSLNQRIIWSFPYSGWTLCTCELEFTHHVVSTADILQQSERVMPIVELVRKVVGTDSSLAVALLPLTSRLYPLLQRLACVPKPPIGVVSSCLACLATLAPHNPHKVWIDVQHTGFLPTFMTCPTTLTCLLSGEGLHPGNFGQFLVLYERPQGEFKVTLSFLKLVSALAKGLLSSAQGSGLGPCFVFVLREIFPRFLKWNYLHPDERLSIGRICLDLLHHVLNCGSHDTSDTGLHSLCLNALLHTEAGATLASLAAIGPSTLDAALSVQPSSLEGPGIQLVQHVKLALSLANNSLRLKPPGPLCALELALIHPQGVQACSVLAVLAQYVHHRFDPGLPRMAILLLKRLSTAAPMSVTACLGHKASAIRDAFVARLLEPTEDTRMKATILEFMAVSVETQPGLIELFLDLRAGDTGGENDGKSCQSVGTVGETEVANVTEKGVSVGKWSCVPAVLALVSGKGGGAKYVPPVLHCAALGFLHALWHDRRDGVTSLLRDSSLLSANMDFRMWNGALPCITEYGTSDQSGSKSFKSVKNTFYQENEDSLSLCMEMYLFDYFSASFFFSCDLKCLCTSHSGVCAHVCMQANPTWESVYQMSLALLGVLLRKLRHRFLPHAFDFLGVHQDRVLQCLQAVRSAPFPPALSAALAETEQTVAFLQLVSCYSHAWRFHLPQLLSSVQVSLCYLCQTCTSLLHRPELLQHYLQAPRKGVVSAGGLYVVGAAEARRTGELEKMRVSVGSSKEKEHGRGREREQAGRLGKECEQDGKELTKVQCSLVRVLAWSLGTLRSFSPDISQLLLDTALEVWEFELLFTLTLSSPPFERDGAPSLGTLLTAVSLAHSLLAEADGRRDSSGSSYSMNMDRLRDLKPVLGFVAEAGLCLLASQALRVFKDPNFPLRDKQRLKRELGAELESLQSSALRQARRGSPVSPAKRVQPSPSNTSPSLPRPSPLGESRLGRPLSLPGPQGVHDSTFPLLLKLLICRVLC